METVYAPNWTISQVSEWLSTIDLPIYKEKFESLRIDGPLLLEITEADLTNDLNIQVRLHRYKILEEIKKLKEPQKGQNIVERDNDYTSIVLKAVEGQCKNKIFEINSCGATIGRHSGSNDYVINESFVSRKHCELRYNSRSNQFLLKDVGSTTGTFLMIKSKHKLHVDFMFQMGLSEFKVTNIRYSSHGIPLCVNLTGYEGPARGKEALIDRNGGVIGRDSENIISIPEDSQLSSKHGKIFFDKKNFYIEDIGSTNKTWLRISAEGEPSADYAVYIDDIIKIGSTVLQVQLNEEPSNKENVSEDKACKICFEKAPDTLCYPCGHLFCSTCLRKCKQCPVCRQEITDKVKVFI